MTLKDLEIGKSARIISVGGEGALRQHFLDMGLIPGVEITLVKYAPMGDPIEILIRGYTLTLRLADAAQIEIDEVTEVNNKPEIKKKTIISGTEMPHPGLGEGGKFHEKATEQPLPDGETLTFALVGNQNCGKTTLFNRLTGSNQHVGNFPGVTVDRKDGVIKGHSDTLITDLPGIYSLSPYSSEELVTRSFILNDKPKGIINIIDASNIERNLYLTMQLLELNVPMVVALNMMDEVRENGGSININLLETELGVPVVPISAAKNEGIEELISHAVHVAKYQERPERHDLCADDDHAANPMHRCIHSVMHFIENQAAKSSIPVRFAATKLIEGDNNIAESLAIDTSEQNVIDKIVVEMEKQTNLDRAAAIANMRFQFIENICNNSVIKPHESKESIRSKKLDKFLTGKYTAIPAFVCIMALIFWLTFGVVGAFLQDLLAVGIDALSSMVNQALQAAHVNAALHSLVIDGIFEGVGSVLSFLPIIVTLFFFLSILEDTGYVARVAFVMDKLLRKIGLSGKSIVPMLIGFGCTVPAVMSTRTLPSERDRKMTVLLTPFMSCSAKLPIYGFFAAAFFPKYSALVMVLLYFGGILVGILIALLFKETLFKGEAVPFVMELPNYRLPSAKSVAQLLWEKAKDFMQRAFTVIFVATIVIWFLQTFDFKFNMVTDSQNSMLAWFSGIIAPIFKPVGFGDWRISTALISGFMAKESVVSTLSVLMPTNDILTGLLSTAGAASLLTFCLLYTPCVAAVSAIKRELGGKWAFIVVFFQCGVAWLVSLLIYIIGSLIALL